MAADRQHLPPATRPVRRRRRPPHWFAGRRIWPLALLALIPLALAPPAVLGTRAAASSLTGELRGAETGLQVGLKQLEQGYRDQDPGQVQAAGASFARSRDRLQALSRQLGPLDVAAGPVSVGPVRSRVATLTALINMAQHLDRAGEIGAQALVGSGLVGRPGGTTTVDTAVLTGMLSSLRTELLAANSSATWVDVGVLPSDQQPTLRRALLDLRTAVNGLGALWPSLSAVLDLLGLDGPRTYLIEQTNPAELRAGGGFIGTVSLVHADRGRVTLAQSLPVEAFDYCNADGCVHPRPFPGQPGYVAPPAELAGPPLPIFSQLTAWSLEDSGFYPDFATNATTAENFARRLLGTPVDGVIAADYYAVAPLLGLTGPIALPQFHVTLTQSNFVNTVVGLDLARDPNHKTVIADAAAQIVARLSHLQAGDLAKLVRIVEGMVRSRHLQIHFDQPGVERQAARLDSTDTLNPLGMPDFMMETEDNYGGSKSNFYLQRKFRLDLTRTGSVLQHRLTVDLHDGAPADRVYDGPHYYAYLRITVPADATGVAVSSAPSDEYAPIQAPNRTTQVPPPGAQVAGGWIFVLVGPGLSGDYEATFTWDTPWQPAANGTALIYWQKQPGTLQDPVRVTWSADGGASSTTSTDLSSDRLITLSSHGVSVGTAPPSRQP